MSVLMAAMLLVQMSPQFSLTAAAAGELTTVYWNPGHGNDANDGTADDEGSAVRTFERALALAGDEAVIIMTSQYQINADRTLDGGGKDITIRMAEPLSGNAFVVDQGITLTIKNIAFGVDPDDPTRTQMIYVMDNATLIIDENVSFFGSTAVWLNALANPIQLAAPIAGGLVYINTVAPALILEGKVLVTGAAPGAEDYFYLTAHNRKLQLEDNGDMTVQRAGGSMAAVYVSTMATGASQGNDSNDGDSVTNPVLTYAKAIELLDDDGIIYVCGGAWNLNAAFGGATVIEIRGVTIKRAVGLTAGTALFAYAAASNITIDDSVIDNETDASPPVKGTGALIPNASYITIRNSTLKGCAGLVVGVTTSGYRITIENSTLETTGARGVQFYGPLNIDATNTFITSSGVDIFVYSASDTTAAINITSDTVALEYVVDYSARTPPNARKVISMTNGESIAPYHDKFTIMTAPGWEVDYDAAMWVYPARVVYVNDLEGSPGGRGSNTEAPVTLERALYLAETIPEVELLLVMVRPIVIDDEKEIAMTKSGVSIQKHSTASSPNASPPATAFTGELFTVTAAGELTLKNITVSGARNVSSVNGLVYVNGGKLTLGTGAELSGNGSSRALFINNVGQAVMDGCSIISASDSFPAATVSGGLFDIQNGTITATGSAPALRADATGRARLYNASNITGSIFCSSAAGVIPLVQGENITRSFDVDFDGSMYSRPLVDGSEYPALLANYHIANPETFVRLFQDGDNVVVGNETIIYLDGTTAGNDGNNGTSPATPVRTFARARELLIEKADTDEPARLIYITGTVTVTGTPQTWDAPPEALGAMLKRFGTFAGIMIDVEYRGDLTLKDITIDGNSEDMPKATGSVIRV
ncbi:MAG: right-handed parallel beta-helix repeat-containing protein, partial [Oscillospiraceae bacterium]|nr:right-handed parallel beta-helix repeat-containing protein [Oscillospiraceae bacterium]